MKRPVGIVILGILWIFSGVGALFSPWNRPVFFGGMLHIGVAAVILHFISCLIGVYLGYGLLKPGCHIWYSYLGVTGFSSAGLTLNLLHAPKIWELYLLLQVKAENIPRFVALTIDTHYVLIAIYLLTALYVYGHKMYFWGEPEYELRDS